MDEGRGRSASESSALLHIKVLDEAPRSFRSRRRTFLSEARAIWKMAWKVSLVTVCQTSLPTISAGFLGHLGNNELAGSALANIWISGVQVVIYGFAVALCTLCGQAYGAENYELVGIWLQLGIFFLTLFTIPVCFSFFYVDVILSGLTDDPIVLGFASTYAKYSALSIWPQCVYYALRQYFQAQEIVTPATVINVLSVFVCIGANYILIIGVDGYIDGLGFIGSPLAQFIASVFQPLALVLYACYYRRHHEKTWYGFTWDCLERERVKRFLSLSLGMTVNMAMDEWVYSFATSLASYLGPVVLSANSILFNLWNLVFGVYWGFGLPTQVRTANFLGSYQPDRAKRTMYVGFVLGAFASISSALVVYIFRYPIVAAFTPDKELQNMIHIALPIFCIAVSLSGLHLVLAAVVEGMSLASTLVCITGVGSWAILLPGAYLLGIVWNAGLIGLWWGSVLGELSKFFMIAFFLSRIDWDEMAILAVKMSEGELDDEEVEADVIQRMTRSMSTPSLLSNPVLQNFSTPQQVRPHHRLTDDERMTHLLHANNHHTTKYGTSESL
ncbi:Multidrug/Oligosaccharidyl-lipid/Polysaccharide (MOP) Flippase Superfamily [Thraustotheca clavata]|uniref:Multidrug/Oligosaccharidyl-lipid/Polysaccharide (MOP) Flippase Superfamily n=1 Tax=Thraustotheca clavata TaxID=74557 RepID=A0A1V9ZZK2_9STRA|nr:Multidrug/Oligosaccharidyl-lipid/Polysaccharide (MOP) Flippase Superfamily [Thraustotheca clavata]